jgi:hypothetical protein
MTTKQIVAAVKGFFGFAKELEKVPTPQEIENAKQAEQDRKGK